ncbi:MAG: EAL domain-containing protein [Lachnospiraceae bacterium]|nr:EAL domain-containing protein [Candidatus Colinaster scatohippi]
MGVWYMVREKRYLQILWIVPFLIDVVVLTLNLFTGWVFSYDDNRAYYRGPLMLVLFVVAFYYMVASLIVIVRFRNLGKKEKNIMLGLFLPINVVAVIIQMINPQLRLDIIGAAIYTVIVAVSVQRPEEYYDYITNTQSGMAFVNELKMAQRAASPLCLNIIRITNNKSLRASIGLEKNTYLLRSIADKLKYANDMMRTRADIFYLDDGIFAIVSSEHYTKRMEDMAKMLIGYVSEPIKIDKMEVLLEVKSCIVEFPRDIQTANSLINFINDIDDMVTEKNHLVAIEKVASTKDFKMKNDMNTIIEKGILYKKFQMYYQPIYSVKDKKFLSGEALIRLIDGDYGFVSPGLFIPNAEKTGAIHQIGDYVFRDVFRFMDSDEYKELGMDYIEINLSVAQCIEYDLVDKVKGLIEKTNIRANQINLEITETAVDYDPTITDSNIKKLSEMGFTFSLDDYGTGYSNIRRVVSLPISLVKIDKSLVDEIDDPQMWIVITNTVNMIKSMNKKVLVEGVEDARTAERFIELGCDYIQGFYYSKPLPEKDFIEFVKRENAQK